MNTGTKPPVTDAEFEVLPPERPGTGDSLPRLIAWLLDNLIKVPGTRARIGLNPFLDFLPVIGDAGDMAATFISAMTIVEAARRRVPKIILARMAGNIFVTSLMGVIPGLGGAFAFWYKPSTRNYQLLMAHAPSSSGAVGQRQSTIGDWVFVLGLMALLLVAIGVFIGAGLYISYSLLKALF